MYNDDGFSKYVKTCCQKVLGLTLSNNDFRHYHNTTHIDWNKTTQKERQNLAVAMGDKNVETAMGYIVPDVQKGVVLDEIVDDVSIPDSYADLSLDEMFKKYGMMMIEIGMLKKKIQKKMMS